MRHIVYAYFYLQLQIEKYTHNISGRVSKVPYTYNKQVYSWEPTCTCIAPIVHGNTVRQGTVQPSGWWWTPLQRETKESQTIWIIEINSKSHCACIQFCQHKSPNTDWDQRMAVRKEPFTVNDQQKDGKSVCCWYTQTHPLLRCSAAPHFGINISGMGLITDGDHRWSTPRM